MDGISGNTLKGNTSTCSISFIPALETLFEGLESLLAVGLVAALLRTVDEALPLKVALDSSRRLFRRRLGESVSDGMSDAGSHSSSSGHGSSLAQESGSFLFWLERGRRRLGWGGDLRRAFLLLLLLTGHPSAVASSQIDSNATRLLGIRVNKF